MSTLILILELIILVVIFLLTKFYFPSYLRKKGENLATKEDIAEITQKVESVKHEYSAQLESIKAALGSQLYIHRVRYEKEFEILSDLSEKLVELKNSALGLRPAVDTYDPDEAEEERKRKRLTRYHEASMALFKVSETRKPFFPEEIYKILKELDRAGWHEVIQYRSRSPYEGRGFDPDYWEKALENSEKISAFADQAIEAIRHRIKRWEKLDFSELRKE